MAQIEVTRDLLVEDSVFILQCLRQNQRGGRPNALADVRLTLANSVTLDLSDYVSFLRQFGYLDVDAQAAALLVTPHGDKAAVGVSSVADDVGQHFAPMIAAGSVLIDDVEGTNAIEELLRSAGIDRTSPETTGPASSELLPVAAPRLAPVEGELGQGAVGRVRVARYGELGLAVAVKELKPLAQVLPWLTAAELLRRVRREALAQAQLAHPCVLPVLDVREDLLAVVMPLAATNLRARLVELRQLALPETLRIATQIALALAHAHGTGLVHTALKPENVLLDNRGNVLLSDFGVARLVALPPLPQPAGRSPRVVVDLGDQAYRAPETSAASAPEAPADAFALGAVLYEMLSGKAPRQKAPVPSLLRPECPRQLDDLIEQLLDDDAARRPTLAAAAARLQALLDSQHFVL